MPMKTYRLRGLAVENGKSSSIDLHLEFDGSRAFVIWDSVTLGNYELKARLEIDPTLLQRVKRPCCDFLYRGTLILPRPQDN